MRIGCCTHSAASAWLWWKEAAQGLQTAFVCRFKRGRQRLRRLQRRYSYLYIHLVLLRVEFAKLHLFVSLCSYSHILLAIWAHEIQGPVTPRTWIVKNHSKAWETQIKTVSVIGYIKFYFRFIAVSFDKSFRTSRLRFSSALGHRVARWCSRGDGGESGWPGTWWRLGDYHSNRNSHPSVCLEHGT